MQRLPPAGLSHRQNLKTNRLCMKRIERQKMKDEDFAKMILGMMEAREKERMLGIRVLIIAHNAYKFQGCAQIYRNYLPQHIAIHVRKQYLAELNRKRKGGRNAQGDSH